MQHPLSFTNLTIGYRQRRQRHSVAEGLTASMPAGQLTVLVGANGAGKSTLLRTLSGLQPALAGACSVMGRTLASYTPHQLARQVSVVLTSRPEAYALRVDEMVAWGRIPYLGWTGRYTATDRRLAHEALETVQAAHLASRTVSSLSDGERARVCIAKALAQNTPIILLDEPTAFLDYPAKRHTFQLLRQLAEERGKAILVSTHDLDMALRFAHQAWLLQPRGITVETGEALSTIVERYFKN